MRSRSRFRPTTAGEAYRHLASRKGLIDRSALPLPHPPGSCLAACPGLYRRFCSPPRPAAAHRSAKPACSPSSLSACSGLPLQRTPTLAVSAPRFLCSSRQPPAALPLRPFVVLRPRTSLLPFTFCPSSHVPAVRPVILYHFPSQPHFGKSPMFPYAAPRNTQQPFCAPRAQNQTCLPPAQAPLHSLRAPTARPFTFLLISCLPLPLSLPIHHSHQSRSPRMLSERIRHTAAADPSFHLSQHRRPARHALPSASSPM